MPTRKKAHPISEREGVRGLNVPLARLTPDVRTEAEFYMPTTGLVGHPIVLLRALVS